MKYRSLAVALALAFAATFDASAADKNAPTLKTPFGTSAVQSFSWGATNSVASSGSGAGAGKVTLQELQVTRSVDAQSPFFLLAVATGSHIPCAELASGSLRITLRDVVVSGYQVADAAGKQTPTVEQLALAYTTFSYTVDGVTQGSAAACS